MDELFVDPNQMVREAIVSALRPHARLASSGWGFYPTPGFDSLDAQQRMLVVLLGRKASHLSEKTESDHLPREELCSLAGVADGTYRPYAPRMERAGLIRREGDDLWIPDESVVRASNVVLGRLTLGEDSPSRGAGRRAESPSPEEDASESSPDRSNSDLAQVPERAEEPHPVVRVARRKTSGPHRARTAKDFRVLYTGKVDLSSFPHPDDTGDSIRLAMLPLLVAREGYNLEGLPVQQVVDFLHEKYGRELTVEDATAALNRVKGKYVDQRNDSHLNQAIFCLLEQGRTFLVSGGGAGDAVALRGAASALEGERDG